MTGISLSKLVVLALIALIVLGPEKLPTAARTAGALLRRLRAGWEGVQAEVARELQIEDIRRQAREAAALAEAAQSQLNAALHKLQTADGATVTPAVAPASASLPDPPASESTSSENRPSATGTTTTPPQEPPHGST